jgi:hypothetical protein
LVTGFMKRLRAGAYGEGDYLIRYMSWLGEDWDGPRSEYRPWRVYRRGSSISDRVLLEKLASLDEATAYVKRQLAKDGNRGET